MTATRLRGQALRRFLYPSATAPWRSWHFKQRSRIVHHWWILSRRTSAQLFRRVVLQPSVTGMPPRPVKRAQMCKYVNELCRSVWAALHAPHPTPSAYAGTLCPTYTHSHATQAKSTSRIVILPERAWTFGNNCLTLWKYFKFLTFVPLILLCQRHQNNPMSEQWHWRN